MADPNSNSTRKQINFNYPWRFLLGDSVDAEKTEFDDRQWETVGLPHSFSLPYFAGNDRFYVGFGWYRKLIECPDDWKGKNVSIEFEGVFQEAEVFLNGMPVGSHQGGYTGFSIDLTRLIQPGKNILAVRVNNRWNAQLAPRAGEHAFSGGIYRNVHLVIAAPVHVAWYGTRITTPEHSHESATVKIVTEISNTTSQKKSLVLKSYLNDPNQKLISVIESKVDIDAGKTGSFEQISRPIAYPQLWSPESPTLYTVLTQIEEEGKVIDDYSTTFGIRWFEFSPSRGFSLNGDHYYLKGANVHQDHAGWGDAVTESGMFRDLQMMKEIGFNFIRGSHYPHSPHFSEGCDRLGLLFWSEAPFWGTGGFKGDGFWDCSAYPVKQEDKKPFEESVKRAIGEMIRIHQNHPSIIVWSLCNEPFFSDPKVMPDVRRFLKELVDFCRQLDPSRPVAIGGCQRGQIDKLGDIAGYNGDGARLAEYINPGVASVVSEYGSTIADRPGKYEPGWGDLPQGPNQTSDQKYSWRYPWRAGEAIWCGFDHGSIAGRRFGGMGLVDYFRLPKRQWFWYRNEYKNVPPPKWPEVGTPAALTLTADRTQLVSSDGRDDALLVVSVLDADGNHISNCPQIQLEIISGPGEFPTGRSITFSPDSDITIRDGQVAIEFRSYYAGKTTIRATSPGLKPAELELEIMAGDRYIPGVSLLAKNRPYRRFEGPRDGSDASGNYTFYGRENPTRASSEIAGHSARMANDGNPDTQWIVSAEDRDQWWQVDLERFIEMRELRFSSKISVPMSLTISISSDNQKWTTLVDNWKPHNLKSEQMVVLPTGSKGRLLRINFHCEQGKASLSDIRILGIISE